MHVLTKIFVVLVSLLAVLLVPLVVVYATNENSYKSRYQEAESLRAAAVADKNASVASATQQIADKDLQIQELRKVNGDLQIAKTAADTTVRQLEAQVATAKAAQATVTGDIATIKTVLESGQQLTESLVAELRTLRTNMVAIERQKVELDEALRDVSGQLEVAENARRALAEELARLKDEHSKTLTKLGMAIQRGFDERGDVRMGGIRPDKTMTATIIRIDRNAGQVLAEIDAGSRDGVQKDWTMTIGNNDGGFVANLRIINVDVNRATGVVSLEDKNRGLVQLGYRAHAVAGQN